MNIANTTLSAAPATGLFAKLRDLLPGVDMIPVVAAGVVQVLCVVQLV